MERHADVKAPKGWHREAHGHWLRNERLQAVQAVLEQLNTFGADKPTPLILQLAYYFFLMEDYRAAAQTLEYQATRVPNHLETLLNLAVCYSRIGRDEEAIARADAVLASRPDNVVALDILAKCLHALGRDDEASAAGTRALEVKDRACDARIAAPWRLPAGVARSHARHDGKAGVIAFSLWGDRPQYLRGALHNLLLAPDLFPDWRLRFYVDETVPAEFIALVGRLGGEVLVQPAGQTLREKLCWRFQVANDPTVGRFLVRDTDSVIGLREARAVRAWLDSDRWFHVMRDWWTHTDLVLAGMWGGVAGVLPPLAEMLATYTPVAMETPNVDQWFLRDVGWAFVRQSCLVHDRCFRMAGSDPFPGPDPEGGHHVGQDEFAARRHQQERFLLSWIERYSCLGALAAADGG